MQHGGRSEAVEAQVSLRRDIAWAVLLGAVVITYMLLLGVVGEWARVSFYENNPWLRFLFQVVMAVQVAGTIYLGYRHKSGNSIAKLLVIAVAILVVSCTLIIVAIQLRGVCQDVTTYRYWLAKSCSEDTAYASREAFDQFFVDLPLLVGPWVMGGLLSSIAKKHREMFKQQIENAGRAPRHDLGNVIFFPRRPRGRDWRR